MELEMLSVENKLPTFNNFLLRWPWTGDFHWMQGKSNLVTFNWWPSNLHIQTLAFSFHDLGLDPMTLVLKLDLNITVPY